ncbi:MAG: hypothetical protein ACE15C_03145 [Phycisphaerae bacterium]
MRTAMLIGVGLLGMGAFILWGCEKKVVVVERQRPAQVIYVREPPPPLIIEERPPRPSRTVIWIDGYWGWDNDHHKHYWVKGHWQEPPRRGAVWVQPKWEHEREGYRLQEGHWK